jgi:predicted acetyltransferase
MVLMVLCKILHYVNNGYLLYHAYNLLLVYDDVIVMHIINMKAYVSYIINHMSPEDGVITKSCSHCL